MKGCKINMSLLDIIIGVVVISLCLSIAITAIIHRYDKKHKEEIGMLKAKVYTLEERLHSMEEYYTEHMTRYH